VGGEEVWGLLDFVVLVCVWVYFCCSCGCLCQGLQGLGLYTVGTVSQSAGGECVRGSSSVLTGWGRIGGEVKIGKRVDEKQQKD
jgi:hypothetical protein